MKLYVVRKDGRYLRSMFGGFDMETKPTATRVATFIKREYAQAVAEGFTGEVVEVKRGKGAELEVVS